MSSIVVAITKIIGTKFLQNFLYSLLLWLLLTFQSCIIYTVPKMAAKMATYVTVFSCGHNNSACSHLSPKLFLVATFVLNLLLTFANLDPDQGRQNIILSSFGSKLFDTLIVFHFFVEKVNLKKQQKTAEDNKSMKNYPSSKG